MEGGDIVTVKEDQFGGADAHIEIVGSIDDGIAAARWSPDEELMVLVTKTYNVIFMGSSLDPVAEVVMTAEDLGASKHVSVGWGKKETQFQGRGAKALRDPTIPEKVDQGLPSTQEDGSTTISWRGDGAYVAINAVQRDSRRVIRVYSREGELDSASEPVDGLEGTLSWRPSGNLMAGIQRLQDKINVVFFERNGLRHGEFTLRSSLETVESCEKIQLEWNSDSTALAVILSKTIQLWTMGNYHWYLKQEIPKEMSPAASMVWHPEKALRFAIASSNTVMLLEQIFHTSRGSCNQPHDIGAVAVIDGTDVKLTPFRTANIPPPMSFCEVEAASSVIDVAFGNQNASFAVLHHKGVDIYDLLIKNGRATRPSLQKKVELPQAGTEYSLPLRVIPNSDAGFRLIGYQGERITNVDVASRSETVSIVETSSPTILATATYDTQIEAESYGQDGSGKLYQLSSSANDLLPVHFPTLLPWFDITKGTEGNIVAFGLSRNGHIYANTRVLAKNCTSFVVTPQHLIFTTSNHFVKYVHLMDDIDGRILFRLNRERS
jgi:elongator complex protein 1